MLGTMHKQKELSPHCVVGAGVEDASMQQKSLRCYAHGRPGEWQAICLDFDIAVQGKSFEEVRDSLREAIRGYIEHASTEDEQTRHALLNRRAPFLVYARCWLHYHLSGILHKGDSSESHAGFQLPCPA
jgi:hypothetical protein